MSNAVAAQTSNVNYYGILALPFPQSSRESQLTSEILKSAYRKALLLHHPDKNLVRSEHPLRYKGERPAQSFSVDQIVTAYEALANPALKAAYDEALIQQQAKERLVSKDKSGVGVESFDLEELQYHEARQVWSRGCRCGGVYQVTDSQLEEASADGEVLVGCHGCSLRIKLAFDVVDV